MFPGFSSDDGRRIDQAGTGGPRSLAIRARICPNIRRDTATSAKARAPYEFGVKVSLTTTNKRCKGGQFILHAKALPGTPSKPCASNLAA